MGKNKIKLRSTFRKALYFIVFSSIFVLQNFGGIKECAIENLLKDDLTENAIFETSNLENFDSSSIVDDFGTSRLNNSRFSPESFLYTLNIYFSETENYPIPVFEWAESVLHYFLFLLTPF